MPSRARTAAWDVLDGLNSLGTAHAERRRVYWLTLLYLVLRTAAFAMIAGVETRYIVETVPLLECLAVLVATSLWPALRHVPAHASGPVARPGR